MAVQSDTSRISYAGNNSTSTSYAVPFVFLENAHLKAIAKTSAGVESVVTLTNHTGAGNVNGGTVRTSVAIPATSTLTIYREVPATQTTTYAEGGDFPAASHERALDKLTQISQQNARKLGSALRLSEANQIGELNPPLTNQQHILSSVGGAAPSWQALPSLSIGPVIATGSTAARSVQDRFADVVNVKDFGAVGDGVVDDTASILAAKAAAGDKLIYLPEGTYKCTQYITLRGFGAGRMLETAARLSELAPILPAGATSRADEYAHLATGGIACGAAGESGQGTLWKCGPNPAWTAWSPTKEGSAMEMTLNPRGLFVEAEAQSGTNKIILTFTVFPPIANLIKPNDIIGFGSSVYRVDSLVFSGSNIAEINLKTFAGGSVSFASTFKEIARWAYIIGDVRVNIAGATVTRIGGDSFAINSGPIADSSIIYNGTQYALATRNENVVTATGLNVTANNVWITYKLRVDAFNILRLQGLYGTGEENFAIVGGLDGSWMMSTQFAQMGKYRNLQIGLGSNADKQADVSPIVIHPDTKVSVGNQSPQSQPAGAGIVTIGRSVSVAQGGTATTVEVARAQADFAGAGYRALTVDFKNNFEGPVLQGWNTTDRTGPTSIYVNPDGGSTMLNVAGTVASPQGSTAVIVGSNLYPSADNTYTCGANGNKWSAIWAQNGTVQTSDERDKTNIADSQLGLDFVNNLHPVSYTWIEGGTTATEVEEVVEVQEPVYEEREVQRPVYEKINGKLVEKLLTTTENIPVYDEEPVFDENGEPLYGDNGKQITKRVHRTQAVQKTQKRIERTPAQGNRTHYGLIAQEVKAAVESAGVADFGGWVLTDLSDDESPQALRYDQFIAPLIKAVQELSARVEELENQ
jgi:hypothetical protein